VLARAEGFLLFGLFSYYLFFLFLVIRSNSLGFHPGGSGWPREIKTAQAVHDDAKAAAMRARGCLPNRPAVVSISREKSPPGKCKLMAYLRCQQGDFPCNNF
jgi:hypothetical protein